MLILLSIQSLDWWAGEKEGIMIISFFFLELLNIFQFATKTGFSLWEQFFWADMPNAWLIC